MQLAKLVQAGSLSMPRGLDAYFDDRPSLLDQLFTILTQDDIQGLLPDILKVLNCMELGLIEDHTYFTKRFFLKGPIKILYSWKFLWELNFMDYQKLYTKKF